MSSISRKIGFPAWTSEGRWGVPVWFAALASLAILLRGALFIQYLDSPFLNGLVLDADSYWAWSWRIAHGEWIPREVFHQGPLYPYLLGLCRFLIPSFSPAMVAAGQLLLNWITSMLFLPLLSRLGRRGLGLASASLALFFSPAVFMSLKVLNLTLGLFLLQTGFLFVLSPRRASRLRLLAAGCLWGLACLSIPGLLLAMPFLLPAVAVLAGPRAFSGVLPPIAVGLFLVICPVTVQNYLQDGSHVIISSNYGLTFAQGNNAQAFGVYSRLQGVEAEIFQQEMDSKVEAQRDEGRTLNSGQVARHYLRAGMAFVTQNPGPYLVLALKKLTLLLGGLDIPLEYSLVRERRDFLALLWLFPLGGTLMLMLSVLGFSGGSSLTRPLFPFLTVALSQGAACLIFFVANRYALPFVFFLIPLAALGLRSLWTPGKLWVWVGLPAVVLLAAMVSPAIVTDKIPELAYLNNLAVNYTEAGERGKAAATLARSLRNTPEDPFVLAAIGRLHLEDNDFAAAVDAFERAAVLDPANTPIKVGLARSYLKSGRLAEARGELRMVREGNPPNVQTRILIAQLFLDLGDLASARQEVRDILQIAPESPGGHYLMSTILRDGGDRAGAIEELKRAIESDSLFPEAYNDLAVDEYLNGNFQRARELATRAAELGGKVSIGFTEALQKALNAQRLPGRDAPSP